MRAAARMIVALFLAIGCGTSGDGTPKPSSDRAASSSGHRVGKRKKRLMQSPEGKATVAAEASLQQLVLPGPGAAFMERAQALEAALRALGPTIPKGRDLDQLSEDAHYLLGMIESLTAQGLDDPATRRRVGAVVHRRLYYFQLAPLSWKPEAADTLVTFQRGAFCDLAKNTVAAMAGKCPIEVHELPPCCQGGACAESVTVDVDVMDRCMMDTAMPLCSKGPAPTTWAPSCGPLALR
jgi:hypothetical protein